jgi:hypothetical protein
MQPHTQQAWPKIPSSQNVRKKVAIPVYSTVLSCLSFYADNLQIFQRPLDIRNTLVYIKQDNKSTLSSMKKYIVRCALFKSVKSSEGVILDNDNICTTGNICIDESTRKLSV